MIVEKVPKIAPGWNSNWTLKIGSAVNASSVGQFLVIPVHAGRLLAGLCWFGSQASTARSRFFDAGRPIRELRFQMPTRTTTINSSEQSLVPSTSVCHQRCNLALPYPHPVTSATGHRSIIEPVYEAHEHETLSDPAERFFNASHMSTVTKKA
jgi:hypothetical protein